MTIANLTRAELIQTHSFQTVRRAGLAADFVPGADFDIFNVSGVVLVSDIFGIVTTLIGAGALLPFIEITTIVPAATVPLCAVVGAAINADVAGTMYRWSGLDTGVLQVTAVGAADVQAADSWVGGFVVLTAGVINIDTAVAGTGVIDWYITYLPMSQDGEIIAL